MSLGIGSKGLPAGGPHKTKTKSTSLPIQKRVDQRQEHTDLVNVSRTFDDANATKPFKKRKERNQDQVVAPIANKAKHSISDSNNSDEQNTTASASDCANDDGRKLRGPPFSEPFTIKMSEHRLRSMIELPVRGREFKAHCDHHAAEIKLLKERSHTLKRDVLQKKANLKVLKQRIKSQEAGATKTQQILLQSMEDEYEHAKDLSNDFKRTRRQFEEDAHETFAADCEIFMDIVDDVFPDMTGRQDILQPGEREVHLGYVSNPRPSTTLKLGLESGMPELKSVKFRKPRDGSGKNVRD